MMLNLFCLLNNSSLPLLDEDYIFSQEVQHEGPQNTEWAVVSRRHMRLSEFKHTFKKLQHSADKLQMFGLVIWTGFWSDSCSCSVQTGGNELSDSWGPGHLLQDVAIGKPVSVPSSEENVTSACVPHLLPFGCAANINSTIGFESDGSVFKVTQEHAECGWITFVGCRDSNLSLRFNILLPADHKWLITKLYDGTLFHLNRLVFKISVSGLLILCPSPSFCCSAALTSCFVLSLLRLWPSLTYYFCSAFMTFTSAFHIAELCSHWNLTLCPNLLLFRETTCCRLMNSLFVFSLNLNVDGIARRTTYQVGAAALRIYFITVKWGFGFCQCLFWFACDILIGTVWHVEQFLLL